MAGKGENQENSRTWKNEAKIRDTNILTSLEKKWDVNILSRNCNVQTISRCVFMCVYIIMCVCVCKLSRYR